MTDTDHDYSAYNTAPAKGSNSLANLAALADQQEQKEKEIESLMEQLSDAKKELKNLKEKYIPEALGTKTGTIELDDGRKVVIKETLRAGLTEKTREAGIDWLKKNGCGHLVTNTYNIEFPKGQEEAAKKFEEVLAENDIQLPFKKKETVHASTLLSNIKELKNDGVDVPNDIFGIYNQRTSTIKPAK